MAVLSTLKHHGSYDRTCLIYDNLCLYITETEADLKKEHDEHQSKLKAAEALLSETNQRLAYAVNSRDFEKVTVAQGLLEVAHKKMKVAQEEIEDWQKRRAAVDSKRMKMIDNAKL